MSFKKTMLITGAIIALSSVALNVGAHIWLSGPPPSAFYKAQVAELRAGIQKAHAGVMMLREDCIADRLEYPGAPLVHERCESALREEAAQAGKAIEKKQLELAELGQAAEPLECPAGAGGVAFPGCAVLKN